MGKTAKMPHWWDFLLTAGSVTAFVALAGSGAALFIAVKGDYQNALDAYSAELKRSKALETLLKYEGIAQGYFMAAVDQEQLARFKADTAKFEPEARAALTSVVNDAELAAIFAYELSFTGVATMLDEEHGRIRDRMNLLATRMRTLALKYGA